jgi:hypothetical protein
MTCGSGPFRLLSKQKNTNLVEDKSRNFYSKFGFNLQIGFREDSNVKSLLTMMDSKR